MKNHYRESAAFSLFTAALWFLCKVFWDLSLSSNSSCHFTVKGNASVSFSFMFSFFFVKDQIASFQLKQVVVFLNCSKCVFKLISLHDCHRV